MGLLSVKKSLNFIHLTHCNRVEAEVNYNQKCLFKFCSKSPLWFQGKKNEEEREKKTVLLQAMHR